MHTGQNWRVLPHAQHERHLCNCTDLTTTYREVGVILVHIRHVFVTLHALCH